MEVGRSDERLRVEPVEPQHAAELVALGAETGLSVWNEESYRDLLTVTGSIVLRLTGDENSTIAFIAGRVVSGPDGPDAEIYNIAIAGRLQGTGLAGDLLTAFVTECRARGVRSIWLEVRVSNSRAIGFYRKNGFQAVRTRPGYYQDPREDALIMRLETAAQNA